MAVFFYLDTLSKGVNTKKGKFQWENKITYSKHEVIIFS